MTETATPAKRAPRKSTKKTAAHLRVVSDDHKAAMALGRQEGAAIRRYLDALKAFNASKRRGRKRTPESIQARIDAVEQRLVEDEMNSLTYVQLVQEKLDLKAELERLDDTNITDPNDYADDFVKVVKGYSERKGITYAAWRDVGVPSDLLRKAGVTR
jgi:hypothetical protein